MRGCARRSSIRAVVASRVIGAGSGFRVPGAKGSNCSQSMPPARWTLDPGPCTLVHVSVVWRPSLVPVPGLTSNRRMVPVSRAEIADVASPTTA